MRRRIFELGLSWDREPVEILEDGADVVTVVHEQQSSGHTEIH